MAEYDFESVARAASDMHGTVGATVRRIRTSDQAMATLDQIVTDSGFTIGDHVRCCIQELDAYEEAERKALEEYELRRRQRS